DNTIRLWDVKAGTETARLEGHANWVEALAVLPDGRLASGSADNTVRLWNLASSAESARLEVHACTSPLSVLPDGRLLSGYGVGFLLWDLKTKPITVHLEDAGAVDAVAILSHDRIALGTRDRTIRLWDLTSCSEIGRLSGHTHWVNALLPLAD